MPEEQDKEQEQEQEKQDLIGINKFRERVAYFVGIMLIIMVLAPLFYSRLFCNPDKLINIVIGYLSLFFSLIPLSLFGGILMLLTEYKYIIVAYTLYYLLIAYYWCHSYVPFIIIAALFSVYFYYLIKTKELVDTLLELGSSFFKDIETNISEKTNEETNEE